MAARDCIIRCIVLIVIFSSSFAIAQDFHPGIRQIKNKGKLIVAMMNTDHPPFFMVNEEGELDGLDIKLARDIARELGVKVEFNRTAKTFDSVIDMVARKEADVAISKLSKTLKRAETVLFTKPYMILRQGLLINRLKMAQTRNDDDLIEFITNLRGTIGVIAASSYVDFARHMFPSATVKEFESWEEIISALEKGFILAAFRDELEIKKLIRARPGLSLKVQSVVFKDATDPIAMAVSWDNPYLVYWLNEYLDKRNLDLDADKLLREYPKFISSGTR